MSLLLIEDERPLALAVTKILSRAGHDVVWTSDGVAGCESATKGRFDAIVLDVMLPSMDGLEICRRLRKARRNVPILMVTARDAVPERIQGLEAGADDYLVKPFEFDELLARVRALLRREQAMKTSRIEIDDLVVDTGSRAVTRGGREILLTAREYKLLEALAAHVGQTLSREAIQERVWADETSVSNTVDVCVMNLRRKVDGASERRLIHTVHRVGYVLRTESDR